MVWDKIAAFIDNIGSRYLIALKELAYPNEEFLGLA